MGVQPTAAARRNNRRSFPGCFVLAGDGSFPLSRRLLTLALGSLKEICMINKE